MRTEGRWEWISGKKGEGFSGTIIKDTWTITRGVGKGEGGGQSWDGGEGWEERQKSVLEQQLKKKKERKLRKKE